MQGKSHSWHAQIHGDMLHRHRLTHLSGWRENASCSGSDPPSLSLLAAQRAHPPQEQPHRAQNPKAREASPESTSPPLCLRSPGQLCSSGSCFSSQSAWGEPLLESPTSRSFIYRPGQCFSRWPWWAGVPPDSPCSLAPAVLPALHTRLSLLTGHCLRQVVTVKGPPQTPGALKMK